MRARQHWRGSVGVFEGCNEPLFCLAHLWNVQVEARRRARCYIIVVDASLLGYICRGREPARLSFAGGSGQVELALLDALDEPRPRPVADGKLGSATVLGVAHGH